MRLDGLRRSSGTEVHFQPSPCASQSERAKKGEAHARGRCPPGEGARGRRLLLGPAPAVLQQSRASSAPRPGPAAGPLRGGGIGPAGRPREGRARAPAAGRPPCPSARFLGGRRRLGGERGARLRPPRPAPAGVGEAAAAPPAPPTPEAARPPRGHLRRWRNGSPSAGGGSASPLLTHRPAGPASQQGPGGAPGSRSPHGPSRPPRRGPPSAASRDPARPPARVAPRKRPTGRREEERTGRCGLARLGRRGAARPPSPRPRRHLTAGRAAGPHPAPGAAGAAGHELAHAFRCVLWQGSYFVLNRQLAEREESIVNAKSEAAAVPKEMSCTIEKALADAKALVERLREHDNAAEALIEQTTALNKRVEAMKQYQEEIQELNEVARHRPRSTLVMGIQQENRQIRELQQENKELRTSLEEHQSALELIMSKYREQMFRLLMASKKDDPSIIMKLKEQHSKELQVHVDQITEMAAVMRKAIEIDDKHGCKEQERIIQLEQENKGLREILQITRESFLNLKKEDASESTSLSGLVTSSDLSLRKS